MKNQNIICFYIVSIFLLANGAFATSIFMKLHMPFWRQLIWIIGLYFLFQKCRSVCSKDLNLFLSEHKQCFYWIVFLSILAIILYHFNLLRIIYAWWTYFSGIPFVIFPILLRRSGWTEKKINLLFLSLGLFMSIGLIADYFSGGYFTQMFLLSQTKDLEGLLNDGRYCFLSEAPTTFGVYLSLCTAMSLRHFYSSNDFGSKTLAITSTLLCILGAWFTGSRQIVFVIIMTQTIIICYFSIIKRIHLFFVLGTIIISAILLGPKIKKMIYADEAYQARYSTETISEDNRGKYWYEGFMYCIGDLNLKRIVFGEAVAFVQGQKALANEAIGRHYENTFWSRMSEIGIIGLYLFLLPVVFYKKQRSISKSDSIIFGTVLLSFIFISYISPNGQHQTTQMAIYIVVGLLI